MTPIRPNILPPTSQATTAPQGGDAAKLAAQRAFFAALGQTSPAAAAPSPQTPVSPTRIPDVRAQSAPAEAGKVLRPGSLIDIRV